MGGFLLLTILWYYNLDTMTKIPIISIVGRSGCGKTTLLENLIPELKKRNFRVGTIKHHAHLGFEIDHPGKDTWRHAQAGSDHVVIAAPDKIASIKRLKDRLSLDEIALSMADVDIILTDGYQSAGKPAIEVIRATNGKKPICQPEQLIAVASDIVLSIDTPQFELNDYSGIIDMVVDKYLS